MANLDRVDFRDIDQQFLLVKGIDLKTKMTIEAAGFRIRPDDNAMLVYCYIDYEAGLSFELICAACVFDDGEVSLEPSNKTTSFKFRYGAFNGDVGYFTNKSQLIPYLDRISGISTAYDVSEEIKSIRDIRELDRSRTAGYPDDIIVYFIKEGYQTEGIWCKVTDADPVNRVIKMRLLNQPNTTAFGKRMGDIVDVILYPVDNNELKAVAVL